MTEGPAPAQDLMIAEGTNLRTMMMDSSLEMTEGSGTAWSVGEVSDHLSGQEKERMTQERLLGLTRGQETQCVVPI